MQHSTFSSHQIMQTEIQSTAYIDPRTPLFNLWPSAASNGSAPGREQSTHWLIHSSTVQPTEAPFLHTLEKASQKEKKREKMAPKTKSQNKNEQNRMFSRNKTHAGKVTDDTSEQGNKTWKQDTTGEVTVDSSEIKLFERPTYVYINDIKPFFKMMSNVE